ncbi:MAG: PDZ domain-containing protein [Phycisphaerales bacterium]
MKNHTIHSRVFSPRTRLGALSAAALVSVSGLAFADEPGQLPPAPKAPAVPQATAGATQVHTSVTQNFTVVNSDGHKVEVRVVDGEVFVKVNGEQTHTMKLTDDWDRLTIRAGDDQAPIATVLKAGDQSGVAVVSGDGTGSDLTALRALRVQPRLLERFELDGRGMREATRPFDIEDFARAFGGVGQVFRLEDGVASRFNMEGIATVRPRTMLGITMSEEPGKPGVIVESVIEGTPAAEAQLRKGDRIIEIAPDTTTVNIEMIRSLTRDAAPGEPITVTVLRDEEKREIMIELAPYSSERLGIASRASAPGPWGLAFDSDDLRLFDHDRHSEEIAQLQSSMQQAVERIMAKQQEIGRLAESMVQRDATEMNRELSQLARELEEAAKALSEGEFRGRVDRILKDRIRTPAGIEGNIVLGRGVGERPLVLTRPDRPIAPPVPPAPSEERIRTIESRLDTLESSNKRIEAMLERLLEQMADR